MPVNTGWVGAVGAKTTEFSGLRVSAKYIHSAHAFLGHLIFLMGMIKVSRCFGLKILILKHPWKSEIRPLEPILG